MVDKKDKLTFDDKINRSIFVTMMDDETYVLSHTAKRRVLTEKSDRILSDFYDSNESRKKYKIYYSDSGVIVTLWGDGIFASYYGWVKNFPKFWKAYPQGWTEFDLSFRVRSIGRNFVSHAYTRWVEKSQYFCTLNYCTDWGFKWMFARLLKTKYYKRVCNEVVQDTYRIKRFFESAESALENGKYYELSLVMWLKGQQTLLKGFENVQFYVWGREFLDSDRDIINFLRFGKYRNVFDTILVDHPNLFNILDRKDKFIDYNPEIPQQQVFIPAVLDDMIMAQQTGEND